jgi:hypothetical protein
MMKIKQDNHEHDQMIAGTNEDGIVAGISGGNHGALPSSTTEPRPPTLQVEHPTYRFIYMILSLKDLVLVTIMFLMDNK